MPAARKSLSQPLDNPPMPNFMSDPLSLLAPKAIEPGKYPKKEDINPLPLGQPQDQRPDLPDEQDPTRQPMPEDHPNDPLPSPPDQPTDHPEPQQEPQQAPGKTADDPATPAAHYEARIQILDAFQYPGALKNAPDWVSRNWAAYADYDPIREMEAGPALRVPVPSGLIAIARIGDYVCRQSVMLDPSLPPETRIEVWNRDQFEKLFVPTQIKSSQLPTLPSADASPGAA